MVNSRCGQLWVIHQCRWASEGKSQSESEREGERECCCITMSVWADRINRYLQCNEISLKTETTSACDLIWWRRQTISSTMEKMVIELPIRGRGNVSETIGQIAVAVVVIFGSGKVEVNWSKRQMCVFFFIFLNIESVNYKDDSE